MYGAIRCFVVRVLSATVRFGSACVLIGLTVLFQRQGFALQVPIEASGSSAVFALATRTVTPEPSNTKEPHVSHEKRPVAAEEKPRGEPATTSRAAKAAVAKAVTDLAQHLEIAPEQIEVVGIHRLSRASNSNKQNTLIGWSISLGAHDTVYRYVVDTKGAHRKD